MEVSLAAFIVLYVFSTGRRIFAQQQVHKIAKEMGFEELVEHTADAIKHDRATLALETKWAGTPATTINPDVQRIDVFVDRTLVAIRDAAQAQADGTDEGDNEIRPLVQKLFTAIYPKGVTAVTQANHVDELALVESILVTLEREEYAPIVVTLGLTRLVTQLEKLAKEYREAQEAAPPGTMTFGEVRAARAQGHDNLLQSVVLILARYRKNTPEDIQARTALLAPILKQNDAIRVYLRSRRVVQDVNPDTGEVDPNAPPADPSPPATPPA